MFDRRNGSRAGFETLAEYRERQATEIMRRNYPAMRRAFWASKAEQSEGASWNG